MKTTIVLAVVSLVAAAAVPPAQPPATASKAITIEQLIDIKHPSNPVWSRDSRKIAFTWERAGVANLYVVPADGSSAPVQVTKDGVPGNVFWGPDGSLLFFRGAALMTLPLNGSAPTLRFGDFAPRSPSVSRDGTKVVYLGANNVLRVRPLGRRFVLVRLPRAGGQKKVALLVQWFGKQYPGPVPRVRIVLQRSSPCPSAASK